MGRDSRTMWLKSVGCTILACTLAPQLVSCTRTSPKKSTVRDLLGGNQDNAPLQQMKMKYAFIFIGSGGQKYPVYMSSEIQFKDDLKEATWNSTIDSDGGLVAAVNESKTLKPDKNLVLKLASTNSTDPTQGLIFTAGNPELGRGLALNLKKVVMGGRAAWKAVSLSYYGYDAQIEDSVAATSAATTPTNQLR